MKFAPRVYDLKKRTLAKRAKFAKPEGEEIISQRRGDAEKRFE
jgi:hypothetical protein